MLVTASYAQEQTGNITGKIADQDGNPLPGAIVTLSGPSLMGTRTFVSSQEGDYRFPAVPPGRNYTITVEMPGFQKAERTGIIVSVGKTITIDIQLSQEVQAEEIIVTGVAPTVDVRSTKHSVNYSSDMINQIPLARDYNEIIHSIPGISVNQEAGGKEWGFGAHGENVKKSQVALDGVSMTDPTMGTSRIGVSFDVFEEVEVQIGSLPAEVGMTSGAYVNIVTKSGGNRFSGLASVQWFNESLVTSTVSQEDANAIGLDAPTGRKAYHDLSLSLGGPIIKDKIWFFLNGRILGFADSSTSFEGAFDVTQDEWMAFSKLTFQINPTLKLTGMFSFRNWDKPFSPGSIFRSQYAGQYRDNSQDTVGQVQLNWIMSQNSFLDLRLLYQKQYDPRLIHPEVEFDNTYVDRYTGITTGTASLRSYVYSVPKMGARLGLTHFLDNFLGGSHEIKLGLEYDFAKTEIPWWRPNPITQYITYDGSIYGFKDINPIMGQFVAGLWGLEKGDWESNMNVKRYSAYFQDSFTLKRLTLNFGIRYDESHGNYIGGTYLSSFSADPILSMLNPDYAQEVTFSDVNDIMVWKDFSPRVGLVFDVFGDHTTAFKASWAQYNDDLEMGRLLPLTSSGPFGKVCVARWIDLNRNEQLDLTDRYIVLTKPLSPEAYSSPKSVVDPNIKSPKTQEFMVGIDRELFKDVRFSVTYIHKTTHNWIDNAEKLRGYKPDSGWWVPYTTTEPGNDGVFGTGDDQQITVYGVKRGAPPSLLWYQNIPEAKRTYHGVDFVLQKRMSNNWQFLGSVTLSKLSGNTGEDFEDSVGHNEPFDTPNWFVNRDGKLSWDRPLTIKLQSSVMLPGDFIVSGYFKFFSGTPWGRTLEVQLPYDPANFQYPGNFASVMAEPPDSNRHRSSTILDIRLEKVFRFGELSRLGLFVDVLNLFGDSFYSIISNKAGRLYANGNYQRSPNYGTIASIHGVRTLKLSARFSF